VTLKGNFSILDISQRPHLHLIIDVASYMHLPSNYHIGSADTLLGKLFHVPWFLEIHFDFLENSTILYTLRV
jgi:hypothetical protein